MSADLIVVHGENNVGYFIIVSGVADPIYVIEESFVKVRRALR